MTYSVVLYKGDIGFTSDYSNVLRFDTPEDRDNYFDNSVDGIPINNTDYINIGVFENSIKISFGDSFTGQFIENLDNFSYMRIDTELVKYGTPNYTPYRKYYFINGYNIINSSSNLTTVEFSITDDYWMNYQFHFDLKECNVERSHMDRWDRDGNQIYNRPCMDVIESYMELEKRNIIDDKDYRWCVVAAAHTLGNKPDRICHHIFPVYVHNLTNYNDPRSSNYLTENSYPAKPEQNIYYPSLRMLDNYYLESFLKFSGTNDVVRILSISILLSSPFEIKHGTFLTPFGQSTAIELDGITYSDANVTKNLYMHITYVPWYEGLSVVTAVIVNNTDLEHRFMKNAKQVNWFKHPVKPDINSNYSDLHEPMLFRQPIRNKILSTGDTTAMTVIPDNFIIKYPEHMRFNIRCAIMPTGSYNYITLDESEYSIYDTVNNREIINALGLAFVIPVYTIDHLSDTFYEYCVTQRDSDRQMMFANILTGGIADIGSTAVSAGIGYRANEERARLIDIENSINKDKKAMMHNLGSYKAEASLSAGIKHSGEISSMYRSMASSAMKMSMIGGIASFTANAGATYVKQASKEKAIRNTPGALAFSGNSGSFIYNQELRLTLLELKVDTTSYERYKDIFMKFGYEIASVIKPNIKSRKYFNYIKTNGAILTGNINQGILAKLSTIFDNGVTIWHMDYCTRETLYNYDKENIERSLM